MTTIALDQPTPAEAGYPNDSWTAQITDVDFTSAHVLIYQNGRPVFTSRVSSNV